MPECHLALPFSSPDVPTWASPPLPPIRPTRRSQPPAPGLPQATRFPAFERSAFDNGLQWLAAPARHVPLVTLTLVVPAGGEALELLAELALEATLPEDELDRKSVV